MATDDEVLLDKAVSGDSKALGALLEKVGPAIEVRLKHEISVKYQSVLDATEVMQTTYLEAVLAIRRFQPKGVGGFVRWLERIAENNLKDAIRGLKTERSKNPISFARGDDSYGSLMERLTGAGTTPSGPMKKNESKERLEAAIARLPADYQRVIRMLDLEDRPVEEVAKVMGRSKGAVHMLHARAREHLKEWLGSLSFYFTGSP